MNASDSGSGTAYTRLDARLESRLDELCGPSQVLRSEWVTDYRPGYLLLTVVDDPHTDEQTLGMATAFELVHQYAALRHRLFADPPPTTTTTDLLLAGDALLAEAFEMVAESSVGPDAGRRYRQLIETTLGVTTAYASSDVNPVVGLYGAAARVGGTVGGYDHETRATLRTIGRGIGQVVVGQSPKRSVTDRIDSLHDPLRTRLKGFVATFVGNDAGGDP